MKTPKITTVKAIQNAFKSVKERYTKSGIDRRKLVSQATAHVIKFNKAAVAAAEEIIALYEGGDFDGDRAKEREISDRYAAAGNFDADRFWCAVDYHATMWSEFDDMGKALYHREIYKKTGVMMF